MIPLTRITSVAGAAPVPVGMFDFSQYIELVRGLGEVLSLPLDVVHERLFREAVAIGWNVNQAAQQFHVTPHVFDAKMEALYRTDAFVFELVVVHASAYCCELDRRVSDAIVAEYGSFVGLRVLAFGDGIGTDALRFAVAGHDVTYSEFEGPSSRFARYRFRKAGFAEKIRVVHGPEVLPRGCYDVVICREVLEHVANPPSLITQLREYLARDGIAIVTESFSRVEPAFPTHLAENAKYSGRTEELFVEIGFRLRRSFPEKRPVVFSRADIMDQSRFGSLPRRRPSAIRDGIARAGRFLLRRISF